MFEGVGFMYEPSTIKVEGNAFFPEVVLLRDPFPCKLDPFGCIPLFQNAFTPGCGIVIAVFVQDALSSPKGNVVDVCQLKKITANPVRSYLSQLRDVAYQPLSRSLVHLRRSSTSPRFRFL